MVLKNVPFEQIRATNLYCFDIHDPTMVQKILFLKPSFMFGRKILKSGKTGKSGGLSSFLLFTKGYFPKTNIDVVCLESWRFTHLSVVLLGKMGECTTADGQ